MNGDERKKLNSSGRGGSLRVVFIYALFSFFWILFSDQVVEMLFRDRAIMTLVSMLKGWLFVAVTSLLLYILVQRLLSKTLAYAQLEQEARAETLRASQLLKAIVENSSDAIFAKDRDGRYLLFNQEAARVTGCSAEQIIGQDDRALFEPQQAALIRTNDQDVITENRTNTYEERLSTVDGDRKSVV